MKVYMAPMEGLTDYMFRNAYDEFFGRGKIDKYFMPFISPNQTEKFLAKEMRDISRDNNHIPGANWVEGKVINGMSEKALADWAEKL